MSINITYKNKYCHTAIRGCSQIILRSFGKGPSWKELISVVESNSLGLGMSGKQIIMNEYETL